MEFMELQYTFFWWINKEKSENQQLGMARNWKLWSRNSLYENGGGKKCIGYAIIKNESLSVV